jgi:hypothetical protein
VYRCVEVKLRVSLKLQVTASLEFEAEAVVSVVESLECTKKTNLVEACTDPEGSWRLRLPDFKVVSLNHRPSVTPRKYSWYSFPLEAESTPGP